MSAHPPNAQCAYSLLVFHFHVVVYALHIVVLFKFFDEFFDGFALLGGNLFLVVWDTFKFPADDFVSFVFEERLDFVEGVVSAVDNDFLRSVFVFFGKYFVHAVVDEFEFEFVEVDILRGFDFEY